MNIRQSHLRKSSQRRRHPRRGADNSRPAAAYRRRGGSGRRSQTFYAQEDWHEPLGRQNPEIVVQPPGEGYIHPVTGDEVSDRLAELPARFRRQVEVVQLSRMTYKRSLFPRYGMQWGPNIYLYPIEEDLVELHARPPKPQQLIDAKMYGGTWSQEGDLWLLRWTPETIKDFYLNNVLIHEVGHVNDHRNSSYVQRERYANWFAIEYGYRRH